MQQMFMECLSPAFHFYNSATMVNEELSHYQAHTLGERTNKTSKEKHRAPLSKSRKVAGAQCVILNSHSKVPPSGHLQHGDRMMKMLTGLVSFEADPWLADDYSIVFTWLSFHVVTCLYLVTWCQAVP